MTTPTTLTAMTTPGTATTLHVENVTLALAGRSVVHDVSVIVPPGEVLGVIGPNGAGKSTLLRAAAGLVAPRSGAICLGARDLAAWDRPALARHVAFLPQDRAVHWPVSVATVVGLGRLPHRKGPSAGDTAADADAIARAMASTDIAHLAGRDVLALSGGERARVLLARTLAQEAPILIADEPTAGLDPAHQLIVLDVLGAHATRGGSVLIALHDLTAALRVCTRLLVLKDGRAMALGPPRDVLTPDLVAACFGIRARIADLDGVPIVLPLAPLA